MIVTYSVIKLSLMRYPVYIHTVSNHVVPSIHNSDISLITDVYFFVLTLTLPKPNSFLPLPTGSFTS